MKINALVVSKYKWKTRDIKHRAIQRLMQGSKLTEVNFTTDILDVGVPEIKDKRITQEWFENNLSIHAKNAGFNYVIFQFSEDDGKAWGIEDGIRGTTFNDNDFFGESWVCAEENSIVKFKNGSARDKYTKVVPHEIAHELKRQDITQLEIHDYDYQNTINNIEGFYRELNKSTTSVFATMMEKLVSLQEQLKTQTYVRPFREWKKVTQVWGNPDPVTYPMTGVHIGTDFSTPLGTPILAPLDCEITRTGYSDALGNWFEAKVNDWYLVALHLQSRPVTTKYKKGEVLGIVGSTGKINGIHAHLEAWTQPMNRSLLNGSNWKLLTKDVTKIIV